MKKLLAMLLVLAMVLSMVPVFASAETAAATPKITKVNMTLKGILDVNFKVSPNGADMSKTSIEITGAAAQTIDTYTREGDLYVYTAKVPAHKLNEDMTIALMYDGNAVHTTEKWNIWTDYLSKQSGDAEALANALHNYGTYAAAYAAGEAGTPIEGGITAAELVDYKPVIGTNNSSLGVVAALYLDDAADLLVKFNETAWLDTYQLKINGEAATVTNNGEGKMLYRKENLLPQDWSVMYDIQVVDGEAVVYQVSYGVNSYVWQALNRSAEAAPGLNNLLKSMYSYSVEAVAYEPESKGNPIALGDVWMRDPFILNDGDAYYMYGTTPATQGKFQVYSSTDLQNWYDEGLCYDGTTANDGLWLADVTEKAAWAPEVYAYNGAYYMFATFTHTGSYQRTAILKADSPVGPFTKYVGNVLAGTDRNNCSTLDGTLFFVGNTPYMIYCHEHECSCSEGNGTMEYVTLSADLKSVTSQPVELFDADTAVSGSNGVTDGPFVYTEDGIHYLLWSTHVDGIYQLYQTTLTNNNGTLSVDAGHTCLYAEDGGHGMVFTDMNGVDRLVLHTPNTGSNPRAKLYPVTIDNGNLSIDGYKTISDLSELNGQSGDFRLGGNITGNTTTVTGFTGTLDGKGYTVETTVPLFDTLSDASVKNLNIVLTDDLTANGVLANAANNTTIDNVHLTGTGKLTGPADSRTGGLVGTVGTVGHTTINITNCSNAINVTVALASASDNRTVAAGGLVGGMGANTTLNVTNSTNTGKITGPHAAGIVGIVYNYSNKATITGCTNDGELNGSVRAGGMVSLGQHCGTVTVKNSTNNGTVYGGTAGGIAGQIANGTLATENLTNTGWVSGTTTGQLVASSSYGTWTKSGTNAENGVLWRNSDISGGNDSNVGASHRLASSKIAVAPGTTITVASGYAFMVYTFDASGNYLGWINMTGASNGYWTTASTYTFGTTAPLGAASTQSGAVASVRLLLGNANGTNAAATTAISYTASGAVTVTTPADPTYAITYAGVEGATHTNPTTYKASEAASITLTPAEKSGYDFTGWTIDGEEVTSLEGRVGNLTITATWVEVGHNLGTPICNNDGTHTYYCTDEGCDYSLVESCVFENAQCTDCDPTALAADADVRVMNFNVLCNDWDTAVTDPSARMPVIAATITDYAPDVVGIQELSRVTASGHSNHPYGALNSALSGTGYQFVHLQNQAGSSSYTTMIYNTATLELVTHGVTDYSHGTTVNLRNVMWGLFKVKATNQYFIAMSTHWSNDDTARATEATELSALVNRLSSLYGCPVVATGDFNVVTSDTNYTSFLNTASMTDAATGAAVKGLVMGTYHTWGSNGIEDASPNAIDHVAYSNNMTAEYYSVIYNGPVSEASDHYPVYADISLPNDTESNLTEDGYILIDDLSVLNGESGKFRLKDNVTASATVTGFTGTLDGNGKTVSTDVMVFDELKKATVKNLNVNLTADLTAKGILTGNADGAAITDVAITGEGALTGPSDSAVGAVAGTACNSTFTNCSNAIDVIGADGKNVGGIVGENTTYTDLKFYSCSNSGTITATGSSACAGGIVGSLKKNYQYINGCSNSGTVNGYYAGGIVGYANQPNITIGDDGSTHTQNTGVINGTESAGGIIGFVDGNGDITVTNAANSGTVNGRRAGGIGGATHWSARATVTGCTNEGTITSTATSIVDNKEVAGGIWGCAAPNSDAGAFVKITDSTNSGDVYAIKAAGGILGKGQNVSVTITGCTNEGTIVAGENVGQIIGEKAGNGTDSISGNTENGITWRNYSLDDNSGADQNANPARLASSYIEVAPGSKITVDSTYEFILYAFDASHKYLGYIDCDVATSSNWNTTYTFGDTISGGTAAGSSASYVRVVLRNKADTSAAVPYTAHTVLTVTMPENAGYSIGYEGLPDGITHTNPSRYWDGDTTALTDPSTRENYAFMGWYNGDVQVTSLAELSGNVTLTAKWGITDLTLLNNSSESFTLAQDITATETVTGFTGTLDGNGKTVSTDVMVFDELKKATVKNLNVNLTADLTAKGVLTGNADGAAITDVAITGTGKLTGPADSAVGAFAGTACNSTLTRCSNAIDVTGAEGKNVGGIVGENTVWTDLKFYSCSNSGTITATGTSACAGGIVGSLKKNYQYINGCSNSGAVNGYYAGGIVGYANQPNITIGDDGSTHTVNTGVINGTESAGGIIGFVDGNGDITVTNATNKASVNGRRAGGIGGATHWSARATVTGCTNEGDITSTATAIVDYKEAAGGIWGCAAPNSDAGDIIKITNSTNSGNVYAIKAAGGILGKGQNVSVTITGCTNEGAIVAGENVGKIIGEKAGNGTDSISGNTESGSAVVGTKP